MYKFSFIENLNFCPLKRCHRFNKNFIICSSLPVIPLYLPEITGISSTGFVYCIFIEYFNVCVSGIILSL